MIWIESVDGIPIGCHTNTANYHETIKRVNRLMRSMSDWMVRSGDAHQRMIDSWAEKRPVCDYCGEHITGEEAVRLNGEWICLDCLEDFKVNVDDFVEDEYTANEYNREDERYEMLT